MAVHLSTPPPNSIVHATSKAQALVGIVGVGLKDCSGREVPEKPHSMVEFRNFSEDSAHILLPATFYVYVWISFAATGQRR